MPLIGEINVKISPSGNAIIYRLDYDLTGLGGLGITWWPEERAGYKAGTADQE